MSNLLQARRATASQSMRLTSQTKQFIVKHRHLYLQDPNSLDVLANPIKLDILEMLGALEENEDAFELQCKILLLLMNSAMTAFRFPLGMAELRNKTAAMSLWNHLLALRPRNLQTLVLTNAWAAAPNKWNISLLLKKSIFKFSNLQVLKIRGFECENMHLCLIARKLPHLRVLDLELCPDFVLTKRGFVALSKLKSLREFTFTGRKAVKENAMLWCFKFLPHLHVAGFKLDLDGDESTLQAYGGIMKNTFRDVILIRNVVLKLHFLVLINHYVDDNDVLLEEGIALPELRMMCVIRPRNVAQIDFDQFPHLSELGLFDVINNPGLHTTLESVGQRLSKLKLCVDNLQLDMVLQLCPNLSELIVETSDLIPWQSQPLPLLNLQQVQIKFLYVTLTDPLLQLLRLAPNLRSFSIELSNINYNLASRFVDLAREGSCMQKLQHINVKIAASNFEAHKQRFRDILEGCANYLDHLHTVDVAFSK